LSPATTGSEESARTTTPVGAVISSSPTNALPSYTYKVRRVALDVAAGSATAASGSHRRCQIATSASERAAHELGGGGGGSSPSSAPAITVMSTTRPSSPTIACGVSFAHNIVN